MREPKDWCECEHVHHFGTYNDGSIVEWKDRKHPYGKATSELEILKFPNGTFTICKDCIKEHRLVGTAEQLEEQRVKFTKERR